jgi:3-dehydroquinate dehydratase II
MHAATRDTHQIGANLDRFPSNVAELYRTRTLGQTWHPVSRESAALAKILVVHGPNLNLLGTREPEVYGRTALTEIDADLGQRAAAAGHVLSSFQSNAEHELVERVQAARGDGTGFILINPAAFTHTSVALRDALAAVALPFIEVHLSNPHAREPFRHTSYFSDLAIGVVAGFGPLSYGLALAAALRKLEPTAA